MQSVRAVRTLYSTTITLLAEMAAVGRVSRRLLRRTEWRTWKLSAKPQPLNVLAKAELHGLQISQAERAFIERDALMRGNGRVATQLEWASLVRERAERQAEKLLLTEYIGRITDHGTNVGRKLVSTRTQVNKRELSLDPCFVAVSREPQRRR